MSFQDSGMGKAGEPNAMGGAGESIGAQATPQRFAAGHKQIGLFYLWLALGAVFIGMLLSLTLRIGALSGFASSPERGSLLAVLHGSLMVFFVLTTAPQAGFGTYFLPLQIGAREMAFPTLTTGAFWATVGSLAGMASAFGVPVKAGLNLWIASAAIFCLAGLANAINFSVTAIDLRGEGMTLPRLPLTAWGWLLNALLSFLIYSILLAACALLLSDRFGGTHFFRVFSAVRGPGGAAPLPETTYGVATLWQRLFWFFAQAQVYVAMLPCFGIVTHLLATFSRRPVWRERAVVLALCAAGLFGFCIWGGHMFSSGLNPFSPLVFALLASSLGVPALVLIMSWLATLWGARVHLSTAMLFALGFVSLFLSGGLSGIFLARQNLPADASTDDFTAGHFHLVMGVAATFAILGALFFWFPKLFGRRLNEPLGKVHFWLTFAGVHCVFIPMHWLGLIHHTEMYSWTRAAAVQMWLPALHRFIAVAALGTAAAQIIFLANFSLSLVAGEPAKECNPWRATTLEWSVPSPPPGDDFGERAPAVYRGAYEFYPPGPQPQPAIDFAPQHLRPEQAPALLRREEH
jgi:cytochrome c oxidase subunit 1